MSGERAISIEVNGSERTLAVEPRRLLVHVLRHELGLTGTHVGCDTAQCGACAVLLDGELVKSCNVLGVQADGGSVQTIEGLAADDRLTPLQQALFERHAVQRDPVIPATFAYERPDTVDEAVELLGEHGSDARLLAGGQSLLGQLRTREARPKLVVDIGRVAGIRGLRRDDEMLNIGALTTQAELVGSEEFRSWFPTLAPSTLADPMVRNQGTFVGALAHADPDADWTALALVLDVRIHTCGPGGERVLAIDDFFQDAFRTAVAPTEMITHLSVPLRDRPARMAYRKLPHPASGFALVGAAAAMEQDGDGRCTNCRVALTGVGRRATRARAVEDALRGRKLSPASIGAAARHASDSIEARRDAWASAEYRTHLAETLVRRALLGAALPM